MVYSYPSGFIWGSVAAASLLALWIAYLVRRDGAKAKLPGPILLSLLLAIWTPQFLVHEITVDKEQVQWKGGFWWNANIETLRFDHIASICTRGIARGRSTGKVWRVTYKDGAKREISSYLWSLYSDEIEAAMAREGVLFLCNCRQM
jgi:hypothetical protein